MPCRLGRTTDPINRLPEWQSTYPTLHSWKILAKFADRSEAEAYEKNTAAKHGCCITGVFGVGPEDAMWYVYHFNY